MRLMGYHWPGNVRELQKLLRICRRCLPGALYRAGASADPALKNVRRLPASPSRRPCSLDEVKKQRLMDALRETGGNQSEAARRLGISRTSVWNQMKRFHLDNKRRADQ